MAKLYSDVVKANISSDVARGISLFKQYGIELVPGTNIEKDGNCWIATVMDQINNR